MTTAASAALRRSRDILTSDLKGELVLLNPETGDCYTLTGVGATLWGLMSEPKTIDDLVDGVCSRFDVEPERARADAQRFIDDLAGEGLIVREPVA